MLLLTRNARVTRRRLSYDPDLRGLELSGGAITTATDVAHWDFCFRALSGTHPRMGSDTPVLQAMRTVLQKLALASAALPKRS